MRIIAGSAKGHVLKAPKGMSTRPTTDRVREAIFSVLGNFLQDAMVLDAFAGSGALGMEALSRGAKHAVFMEKDRNAIMCVRENLKATKLQSFAQVMPGLAAKLLPTLNTPFFQIVLLDPPYNQGHIQAMEPLLLNQGVLAEDVIVVLETSSKNMEKFTSEQWKLYKTSVYGDTAVLYYGLKNVT